MDMKNRIMCALVWAFGVVALVPGQATAGQPVHSAFVASLLREPTSGQQLDASLLMAAEAKVTSPWGKVDTVNALLAAGASVNAVGRNGRTPLLLAVGKSKPDVMHVLLQAGADVDKASARGETALLFAAMRGNQAMVQALIEAGASVNVADNHGETPLSSAARMGHLDVVRFLIKQGANVTQADNYGVTPLQKVTNCLKAKVINAYSGRTRRAKQKGRVAMQRALQAVRRSREQAVANKKYAEMIMILLQAGAHVGEWVRDCAKHQKQPLIDNQLIIVRRAELLRTWLDDKGLPTDLQGVVELCEGSLITKKAVRRGLQHLS